MDGKSKKILKQSLIDFNELKKYISDLSKEATLEELYKRLNGYNWDEDRFDVNYKSICVPITKKNNRIYVDEVIDV